MPNYRLFSLARLDKSILLGNLISQKNAKQKERPRASQARNPVIRKTGFPACKTEAKNRSFRFGWFHPGSK